MSMADEKGTAQSLYERLSTERSPYLEQARRCAKLTLPHLIRDAGTGKPRAITPWQSIGARGVNNLASKLMLTLLPPNTAFFKLTASPELEREAEAMQERTELERALAARERAIMADIERSGDRVVLYEAMRHLIVAGNALLYDGPHGLRCFHLDRYVVDRDPSGHVLDIVTHEQVSPRALPQEIRAHVHGVRGGRDTDRSVSVYTHISHKRDEFQVRQECMGKIIPESEGSFPADACPWIPLRFGRVDGESYGTGHVEDCLGDLQSCEALSQSLTEGTAAAAKLLFLVNPTGTTRSKDLADAPNCAIVSGNAADVTTLQAQKAADFQTAYQRLARLEESLSFAFLLNTAIQRNGERVTAEEIRYMAGELEDALGGVYAILSREFQLPYIASRIRRMEREGSLAPLPKDAVHPSIVTGIEALGRGHDRTKLVQFVSTISQTIGPQALTEYVNPLEAIKRLAVADGIDTDKLVISEEELAKRQQQAMQAQAQQQLMELGGKLGPEAMRQISASQSQNIQAPQGGPQ